MRTLTIDPTKRISEILELSGYGEGLALQHIKYDKSVNENYDYQVIRSQGHDGLIMVTERTIDNALLPLINQTTLCSATIDKEDIPLLKGINYTIGEIRLETEFGQINAPAGNIPGQTDTVYIPVRCEYAF